MLNIYKIYCIIQVWLIIYYVLYYILYICSYAYSIKLISAGRFANGQGQSVQKLEQFFFQVSFRRPSVNINDPISNISIH